MKKIFKFALPVGVMALSVALVGCKGNNGHTTISKNSVQQGTQLISKLTHGEMTVVSHFNAAMGLIGYIVKAPTGQQTIFYTNAKGDYLIAGNIISKDGKNLTQHYTQQYIMPMQAKTAYANLNMTHYVTVGQNSAPHKMYVLWDPNCIICHVLYGALKPLVKEGKVQLRIIPVAIRGPSSKTKSAQILDAKTNAESAALIEKDEAKFQYNYAKGIEKGALEGIKEAKENTKAFDMVKANTAFFTKSGFQGTPVILYKNQQGEKQMVPGFLGKAALTKMIDKVANHW